MVIVRLGIACRRHGKLQRVQCDTGSASDSGPTNTLSLVMHNVIPMKIDFSIDPKCVYLQSTMKIDFHCPLAQIHFSEPRNNALQKVPQTLFGRPHTLRFRALADFPFHQRSAHASNNRYSFITPFRRSTRESSTTESAVDTGQHQWSKSKQI